MIKVEVFRDRISEDGCIYSGPKVSSFEVNSIWDIKNHLIKVYGGTWHAAADGSDGMWENSQGYGDSDVFVHYSEILREGFKTLSEGNKVSYLVTSDAKGPIAYQVEMIND